VQNTKISNSNCGKGLINIYHLSEMDPLTLKVLVTYVKIKRPSSFGHASALFQEEKKGRIEAVVKSFYLQRNKYDN